MEDSPTPIAELEHGPSKFEEFLENNQKKLMILASLIFLGVLAYVFMTGLAKKNATEAGEAFMLATDEDSLNKVITDYSSSQTAGTAAMAISELRTTDDDRIAALDHFISNYPEHPGVPAKLLELALIHINAGNNADAEDTLKSLISNDQSDYLAPRANIALADIAVSNNQLEKAKQIYTDIKNSESRFNNVAAERLLYLNAKEPVIVKQAPVPTPSPTPTLPTPPTSSDPIQIVPSATPSASPTTAPAVIPTTEEAPKSEL